MYEELMKRMKYENIEYVNHTLSWTKGMIARYEGITVIILDETKITSESEKNTILMQELGHYLSNAYYKSNSPYEVIEHRERIADIAAWETFLPFDKVMNLQRKGLIKATDLAKHFLIQPDYMARCINYYYTTQRFR